MMNRESVDLLPMMLGVRHPLRRLRLSGAAGALGGWALDASPSAVPILFVHPLNSSGLIWSEVAERLAVDRTSLLPDLRAHGTSDIAGPVGLDAWLSDLFTILNAEVGRGPVHVVGGGYGGLLACCLAAARPGQVLSIATLGTPFGRPVGDLAGAPADLDSLTVPGPPGRWAIEAAFAPGTSEAVIARGLMLANPNEAEVVERVRRAAVGSIASDLTRLVHGRALVITGELDGACTAAQGLSVARTLGVLHTVLPSAGHFAMLEQPGCIARILQDHFFLAEREVAQRLSDPSDHSRPPSSGRWERAS